MEKKKITFAESRTFTVSYGKQTLTLTFNFADPAIAENISDFIKLAQKTESMLRVILRTLSKPKKAK